MSGFTQTPNFSLYKPNYNSDTNQWGYHLNANADTLDSTLKLHGDGLAGGPFLPLAGGSVSGALSVGGTLGVTGALTAGSLSAAGFATTGSGNISAATGTGTAWVGNTLVAGGASVPGGGRTITRISGTAQRADFGIVGNVNFAGVASDTPWPYAYTVSQDSVDTTTAGGQQGGAMLIRHNFGGAAMKGARNSLQINGIMTATTGNGFAGQGQYAVLMPWFQANAPDGGTGTASGQSAGAGFAMNPRAELNSGATNWGLITGGEVNVGVHTGASVGGVGVWNLVLLSNHAVKGANGFDSGLSLGAQVGTPVGVDYGIIFGGGGGSFPLDPLGTLIGATNQVSYGGANRTHQLTMPRVFAGVDFLKVNFTDASGYFLRAASFSVDGTGHIASGNAALGTDATGFRIDTPNQIVTAIAIVSGGGGGGGGSFNDYYAGDIVTDGFGGQYKITAVAVGAATALTIMVPGVAASPPANPVALANGSGGGLTINMTWAARNRLSLQPSGGALVTGAASSSLGFYGAAPLAKQTGVAVTAAAIHAALTALGLIAP